MLRRGAIRYYSHVCIGRVLLNWHLSGIAMIIWLTRNWSESELIARAIELEILLRVKS